MSIKVKRNIGEPITNAAAREKLDARVLELNDLELYGTGEISNVTGLQTQAINKATQRGKITPARIMSARYLYEGREVKRWWLSRRRGRPVYEVPKDNEN